MSDLADWHPRGGALAVHVALLGERIDARSLVPERPLGATPHTLRVGENGIAAVYRYGVVVLAGVSDDERAAFFDRLRPLVHDPFPHPVTENLLLKIDATSEKEQITPEGLTLADLGLDRLLVVADVLAKSVVLEHFETSVAEAFDRIEPLAISLERTGRGGRRASELLRHLGRTLFVQQKTVWRVQIDDKPDVLWDHPELERLYERLRDEYEIGERHDALERKLELIHRTVQTLLELLWTRRSLRVEWYIVILIVAEIAISLATRGAS